MKHTYRFTTSTLSDFFEDIRELKKETRFKSNLKFFNTLKNGDD